MKKLIVVLSLLLVCIFVFISCSTSSTSTAAPTTTTTAQTTTTTAAVPRSVLQCPQGSPNLKLTPQYGGTLKLLYPNTPTNIGAPWKIFSFFDEHMNRYAVENLVGLDEHGDPVAQLATNWVSDPVAKTIIFELRKGVVFHDGTPFNATAVKWNLDMYRNGTKPELKAVTSVDVIDDSHVKLTLSSWDPIFVQNLSSTGAGKIVSPTAAQQLGDAIMLNPVGTGPFKFVSFQPNVSLKYTRFNDYWQKGLPYLDGVEISFVADSVVAMTSFVKGEAQAIYGITTKDAKSLKAQGYTVDSNTASIPAIAGDSKNPDSPFADIRVRQAIAYAIDTNTIVNSVFDNMFTPTNQLALPGGPAYDSSIKGYPYNPAKAQELLGQAGYSTAKPLEIKMVYMTNPQLNDLLTAVQNSLTKVGINITLQNLDAPGWNKLIASGWNNQFLQVSFSYNEVETQYSSSMLQNLSSSKRTYVSIYAPAEFDALLQTTMAESDLGKREKDYEQLNKMVIDNYCMLIPLLGFDRLIAKSPSLHDYGFASVASFEFLPERAWISK